MERIMHLERARLRAKESGFTLVELAIVLVIIGLIIGGVLVGQDLIKAAEIRATISQIEGYNSAVNTFRGKYQGLPGDIRNIDRFFDTTTWAGMENGDGDRSIEMCASGDQADGLCAAADLVAITGAAAPQHNGEALQFWHHLSAAELIPGYYNGCAYGGTCNTTVPATEDGVLGLSFPRSKLDRNGIGVFADGGGNFYQIGAAETGGDAAYAVRPSLTPAEAFDLDSKVDDGRPGTGSVVLRTAYGALATNDGQVNDDLQAIDFEFSTGTTSACIDTAIAGAAPTTAEIRSAEYALLNPEVVCSIRFKMN